MGVRTAPHPVLLPKGEGTLGSKVVLVLDLIRDKHRVRGIQPLKIGA